MSRVRLAIVGCGSSTERGLLLHLMLEPGLVEVAALVDTSDTTALFTSAMCIFKT